MQVAVREFFQLDSQGRIFLAACLIPTLWVGLNPTGFVRTVYRWRKPLPAQRVEGIRALSWFGFAFICAMLIGSWLTQR